MQNKKNIDIQFLEETGGNINFKTGNKNKPSLFKKQDNSSEVPALPTSEDPKIMKPSFEKKQSKNTSEEAKENPPFTNVSASLEIPKKNSVHKTSIFNKEHITMLDELTDNKKNIFEMNDSPMDEESDLMDSPEKKAPKSKAKNSKIFSFGDSQQGVQESGEFSFDVKSKRERAGKSMEVLSMKGSDKKLKRKTSYVNFKSNSSGSCKPLFFEKYTQTGDEGLLKNELVSLNKRNHSLVEQNKYLLGKLEKQRSQLENRFFEQRLEMQKVIFKLEKKVEEMGGSAEVDVIEFEDVLYSACVAWMGQ